MVRLAGIEPTTPWFVAGLSNDQTPVLHQQLRGRFAYHQLDSWAHVSRSFLWNTPAALVQRKFPCEGTRLLVRERSGRPRYKITRSLVCNRTEPFNLTSRPLIAASDFTGSLSARMSADRKLQLELTTHCRPEPDYISNARETDLGAVFPELCRVPRRTYRPTFPLSPEPARIAPQPAQSQLAGRERWLGLSLPEASSAGGIALRSLSAVFGSACQAGSP